MKEYTCLAIISVFITAYIDAKIKTHLLQKKEFFQFLAVIVVFMFIVNGFLTGENIVLYNSKFFLNTRISSIPVEDFLFGFSMVALTIAFWEYFKVKFNK